MAWWSLKMHNWYGTGCSRDTGSVRSHSGTWYAAVWMEDSPIFLLLLSLIGYLLSSVAHDDEDTMTLRRTGVIMLIFMVAPLLSVAATPSPSWSRMGHGRRADPFSYTFIWNLHGFPFMFPKNSKSSSSCVFSNTSPFDVQKTTTTPGVYFDGSLMFALKNPWL